MIPSFRAVAHLSTARQRLHPILLAPTYPPPRPCAQNTTEMRDRCADWLLKMNAGVRRLVHEESARRHAAMVAPNSKASTNDMQPAFMISPGHVMGGGVMGGQRCPYFLATDYFVNADGGLPRHLQQGMDQCFVQVMGDPSLSDAWYALSREDMRKAVEGSRQMQDAFGRDHPGFRAFLEIALLARADVCVEKSHMVDFVGNPLRKVLGRKRCTAVS